MPIRRDSGHFSSEKWIRSVNHRVIIKERRLRRTRSRERPPFWNCERQNLDSVKKIDSKTDPAFPSLMGPFGSAVLWRLGGRPQSNPALVAARSPGMFKVEAFRAHKLCHPHVSKTLEVGHQARIRILACPLFYQLECSVTEDKCGHRRLMDDEKIGATVMGTANHRAKKGLETLQENLRDAKPKIRHCPVRILSVSGAHLSPVRQRMVKTRSLERKRGQRENANADNPSVIFSILIDEDIPEDRWPEFSRGSRGIGRRVDILENGRKLASKDPGKRSGREDGVKSDSSLSIMAACPRSSLSVESMPTRSKQVSAARLPGRVRGIRSSPNSRTQSNMDWSSFIAYDTKVLLEGAGKDKVLSPIQLGHRFTIKPSSIGTSKGPMLFGPVFCRRLLVWHSTPKL
ncbi:hypothetical protein B0H11DRAFT_1905042 [Mycena galericulata]|nr:hypothetical protein B0H11DRAFT_1905042 [Mycena galericulata]